MLASRLGGVQQSIAKMAVDSIGRKDDLEERCEAVSVLYIETQPAIVSDRINVQRTRNVLQAYTRIWLSFGEIGIIWSGTMLHRTGNEVLYDC